MHIQFTGNNFEVTPALRAFTEEKFIKLERHFDQITTIHVTFDIEKLIHIAEATIHLSKTEVHAKSESEDMYASVDSLIDKLNSQLLKRKGKRLDHRDHRDHRENRDERGEE